jgi:hypothetical protein
MRVWAFLTAYGGRIGAALAILAELGAALWNAWLHQPIELGSLGGGLAAILTASAALLAAPPAAQAALARQQLKLKQMEKNDG